MKGERNHYDLIICYSELNLVDFLACTPVENDIQCYAVLLSHFVVYCAIATITGEPSRLSFIWV